MLHDDKGNNDKGNDVKENIQEKLEALDQQELLLLLQEVNPCNQAYHLENETFIISYDLKIDVLNFTKASGLKLNTSVIGIPASVSTAGYMGSAADVEQFVKRQHGLWVILNSDEPFSVNAQTLSTFVFENRFTSFDEYLSALRSPYRRRMRQALKRRRQMRIQKTAFLAEHYALYLDVLKRSAHPLETLPQQFFASFGEIYSFQSLSNELLAFVQVMIKGDKMAFLFCGFKKEHVKAYDIYYNMLLFLVQLGIENGVSEIDFGQTSEESKLKIGCLERPKYMYIHHHNPLLNAGLKKLLPLFSYQPHPIVYKVFKEADHAHIS